MAKVTMSDGAYQDKKGVMCLTKYMFIEPEGGEQFEFNQFFKKPRRIYVQKDEDGNIRLVLVPEGTDMNWLEAEFLSPS